MRKRTARTLIYISLGSIILSILVGAIIPGILWHYAYPASDYHDYETSFYEGPRAEPETRPFRGEVSHSKHGRDPGGSGFYLVGGEEYIDRDGLRPVEGSDVIVFVEVTPSWGQAGASGESVFIYNVTYAQIWALIFALLAIFLLALVVFRYYLKGMPEGRPLKFRQRSRRTKVIIVVAIFIPLVLYASAFPLRSTIRNDWLYGDDSYKTHPDWETEINLLITDVSIYFPVTVTERTYILVPALIDMNGELVEILRVEEWDDWVNLTYDFEETEKGWFINLSFVPKVREKTNYFHIMIYFEMEGDYSNFYLFEDLDQTDRHFHGTPGLSVYEVEEDEPFTWIYLDAPTESVYFDYGRYGFYDYDYQGMFDFARAWYRERHEPGWYRLPVERRESHWWDDG